MEFLLRLLLAVVRIILTIATIQYSLQFITTVIYKQDLHYTEMLSVGVSVTLLLASYGAF